MKPIKVSKPLLSKDKILSTTCPICGKTVTVYDDFIFLKLDGRTHTVHKAHRGVLAEQEDQE